MAKEVHVSKVGTTIKVDGNCVAGETVTVTICLLDGNGHNVLLPVCTKSGTATANGIQTVTSDPLSAGSYHVAVQTKPPGQSAQNQDFPVVIP